MRELRQYYFPAAAKGKIVPIFAKWEYGDWRYSSTHYLSALNAMIGQLHAPAALLPG
jgi:hypothetical protein